MFRKDVTELVSQPYESASKEIHTISQQLIKSQLLVQVFERDLFFCITSSKVSGFLRIVN